MNIEKLRKKNHLFCTLLIGVPLVWCCPMTARPAFGAVRPNGDYSIRRGLSPSHIEYTGKVRIRRVDQKEDQYAVFWNIPGYDESRGVGLLDHGKLFVAYSTSNSADFGLAIYKIEGGKLSGKWATPGQNLDSGSEQLTGPAGLNGTYSVNGRSINAGEYSGTVEIYPQGDVYYLDWFIAGYEYTGVGIKEENYLAAAWGPGAGIASYEIKDEELLGRWAGADANRTGIEDLARVSPPPQSIAAYSLTTASPLTFEVLTERIEKKLASINTMSSDYVFRSMSRNGDASEAIDIIRSKKWYKKPGLDKSDTEYLWYPDKPERHVSISKLEGENYNSYELLDDGSVKKSSFEAKEWVNNNAVPEFFYHQIKQRIKDGHPYSLEYDQDRNIYVVKFDTPDEAGFEISGDSWLPYESSVFDSKYNAVIEARWSNIQINPDIPDDMFRVPDEANAAQQKIR